MGVLRATVDQVAGTPQVEQTFSNPEACALSFSGPPGLDAGHLDILRSDGSVACSSRAPKGDAPLTDFRGADWLAHARRGKLFRAPVQDPATGGHAVLSAAPIKGGIVAGFLALEPAGPGLVRLYEAGARSSS